MKQERLDNLWQNGVSLDLETALIQPGLQTPPIVLGSLAEFKDGKVKGAVLSKDDVMRIFRMILSDPRYTAVFMNAPYDINCLVVEFLRLGVDLFPEVFKMFDPHGTIVRNECDGRVYSIEIAEMLRAIADGHFGKDFYTKKNFPNNTGYRLENIHEQLTREDNAKANDRYRLSYWQFLGKPIEELPFEARTYPIDDAVNTFSDALRQTGHLPSARMHDWTNINGRVGCRGCGMVMTPDAPNHCMRQERHRNLHDLSRQTYFFYAQQLGAVWGFKIDHEAVNKLERKALDARKKEEGRFKAAGIIRDDDSENQSCLKLHVARAYGSKLDCPICKGEKKVPSPATNGRTKINCAACDGTGLELTPRVPRSEGGGVSKNGDALQESGDDLLIAYGEQPSRKILTTYIPMMRKARACNYCGQPGAGKRKHAPGCPGDEAGFREVPLNPYGKPLVETGRCAYGDGLHGLPRKGGVRECFVARPGYVFSSEDYTAGELVTLSEACFQLVGFSKLGEALNLGLDAHLALAGTMSGRNYEQMLALKEAGDKLADYLRQAAKAGNFGFGGGMAELTFTLRKRSEDGLFTPCPGGPDEDEYDTEGFNGLRTCILMAGASYCGRDQWGNENKVMEYKDKPCSPVCSACLAASKRLREFWFQQWTEMKPFFDVVKKFIRVDGSAGVPEIVHLASNRIRGGVEFCDGANGIFQGLLADAAKNAFCQITRECYDKTWKVENSAQMTSKYAGYQSPLFGSRPLMMFHDESLVEHPEDMGHDGSHRVSEIMVESLRVVCPNHQKACKAAPALMRRLYKGVEAVYARGGKKPADEYDRLVPWEPKKAAA